jgi:hypothetical protein
MCSFVAGMSIAVLPVVAIMNLTTLAVVGGAEGATELATVAGAPEDSSFLSQATVSHIRARAMSHPAFSVIEFLHVAARQPTAAV